MAAEMTEVTAAAMAEMTDAETTETAIAAAAMEEMTEETTEIVIVAAIMTEEETIATEIVTESGIEIERMAAAAAEYRRGCGRLQDFRDRALIHADAKTMRKRELLYRKSQNKK